MIIDVQKEKAAGYISENNEVYTDAPEYIKEMAKNINNEHKKMFFGEDFFTFTTKKYGSDLLPIEIKLRKELEKQYKTN